jgi:splicing factor 3B subunit 1
MHAPCYPQVQENCIDLVGRIADRGAEFVPAREWMRICFELLEMLKAHKKGIRRATVNTFGYIAKAIGPQARGVPSQSLRRGACCLPKP